MKFILALVLALALKANGEKIIENPIYTDWGDWHGWEYCPEGEYAIGFRLKTEYPQGISIDDTSNNGITFFCDKIGGESVGKAIVSGAEQWGRWGNVFMCGGTVSGFQFRSEPERGALTDDTAANNMNVFCNGQLDNAIYGDGGWFGEWTPVQHCDARQAVCGLRTQVEMKAIRVDETSLNNVQMKCCDIPDPGQGCYPSSSWEKVAVCENNNDKEKECTFEKRKGLSYSSQIATERRPYAPLVYQANGFSIQESIPHLEENFKKNLGKSESFDWTAKDSFWTKSSVSKKSGIVKAEPYSRVEIYQYVGECGIYSVRSQSMKKVEKFFKKGSKKENITYFDF